MNSRQGVWRLLAWGICLAVSSGAASAVAWTEREVGIQGLHGTLTWPDGMRTAPAVLIVAGSGPVDRDGNLPGATNNGLKLLAHGLAEQGIASLRIDKRGIGASRSAGLREEDLRFDRYVDDAVAWLALLRADDRVSRIVLMGHSEGALVATLAAQRAEVAGLVLVAGAGFPAAQLIERQLAAAGMPEPLRQASQRVASSLVQGKPVADVPAALGAFYRPSVQGYLMSWFALDPAKELAKVVGPVLIVQGTTDLQIEVADARRLAAARDGLTLVLVEDMNHVLKEAPTDRGANLLTYAQPERPLAPALLPAVVAFVRHSG